MVNHLVQSESFAFASAANTASVKVNTFRFLRALSYVGLILAGVSNDDHGKCG